MRGLRELAAARNDVARLPPALTRLTSLEALDLGDNPRLQFGVGAEGAGAGPPLSSARRDVSLAQARAGGVEGGWGR